MNYRHVFHAGNICDVVKHVVLLELLGHLRGKETPFCVLDTHAGAGLYDMHDLRALKTGEAQSGIYKLLRAPAIADLPHYYRILGLFNPDWKPAKPEETLTQFRFYPGSPLFVREMLRMQDRLIACEWHPDDGGDLKRQFRGMKQAHVHHRDGYEALGAFLPPAEKRGLVLIDPPYEEVDEFSKLADAALKASKRWPQGIFMLWYPVKDRPTVWNFHEALAAGGVAKILCAEFIFEEETRSDRLNGSGLIIVNPPWQFEERLHYLFRILHEAMQTRHHGIAIKWLTPEE
jgi:23S rRNA (adenine2030-N6)-methyltransferase